MHLKFMTNEELKAEMQLHMDFAKEILKDGDKDGFMPTMSVNTIDAAGTRKTTLVAIATDFNEHEDKHAIFRQAGEMFYAQERVPLAAVLISEAWSAIIPKGEPMCQPRNHPDKKEVIVVMGMRLKNRGDPTPDTLSTMATVTRHDDGHITIDDFGDFADAAGSELLKSFYKGFFANQIRKEHAKN